MSSGLRPLRDYLARFPGFEEDVAREFLLIYAELNPTAGSAGEHPIERYTRVAELGRGGMGVVERVRDTQLDRDLALKSLRRDGPRLRKRFQEEARITSLLDHPGVVPVHESGLDANGTPYFTMRLVEGIDFEDVIARVHAGDRDWTMPRALEALVKVCDTMAFAHARGVVHRDLKPSNVRVGRFGEVYVMDWGLAHEMGRHDPHEIRPRSAGVDVVRGDEIEDGLSVVTLEGDVLGTPAYMPPEQANGEIATIAPHSDVYSVGAMLHHLLSGRRPYSEKSDARRSRDVLELVRAGPPGNVRHLRPNAPSELVAICSKAMQREPRDRYPDMTGFAADLRSFLEGRVVSAHSSSRFSHARKWVARNRILALVVGTALVGAAVALLLIVLGRIEARQRLVQLSGSQLKADFDSLWPPHTASVPVLERWIEDARSYLASREVNAQVLKEMQARALPMNPERPAERKAAADMRARIKQREELIEYFREIDEKYEFGMRGPEGTDRSWVRAQVHNNAEVLKVERTAPIPHLTIEFSDRDEQRLYDAVRRVLSEQAEFETTAAQAGLLGLAEWGLEASRRVERDSLVTRAEDWRVAIRSIRDSPVYKGLLLKPQLGLVPIGPDPDSGLWEFWHVLSGDEPLRDGNGRIVPDEGMGIVLVLLPSGSVIRGSQSDDGGKPNYDPWAEANAPVAEDAELAAFLISKFELTQAQWQRITRTNPSVCVDLHAPGGLLHPVERVSFAEGQRVLRVAGLVLPTEAQWEYAARARTKTPWSTGCDVQSIVGAANFADRTYAQAPTSLPSRFQDGLALEDGWCDSAPVGSFRPNAFGLFDMMGNVREWTVDRGPFSYESLLNIRTCERIFEPDGTKAVRGGSFMESPRYARSAAREQVAEGQRSVDLGLRASRAIEE